jgi:hypothetical protein
MAGRHSAALAARQALTGRASRLRYVSELLSEGQENKLQKTPPKTLRFAKCRRLEFLAARRWRHTVWHDCSTPGAQEYPPRIARDPWLGDGHRRRRIETLPNSVFLINALGHAGPKGSTRCAWDDIDMPLADGNWPPLSASPERYLQGVSQQACEATPEDMAARRSADLANAGCSGCKPVPGVAGRSSIMTATPALERLDAQQMREQLNTIRRRLRPQERR